MIAAIYARKSTDQTGVADEQKSVTRQIEHAREYAESKGWMVDEDSVFIDDGISGAEFSTRPGYVRLMNAAAAKPRPTFHALIMSELSRLGREQIETAMALKQLSTAGVRCFGYLDDRELLMESAIDKFLLSAVSFGAELEREKGRQRARDTSRRKAKAGHVTGGACFGYRNVEIRGTDGSRSHVMREIEPTEADVIRLIFQLSAAGHGVKAIAKILNAEGAPSPRAQCGRSQTWAPTSVRAALYRPLYRGEIVWGQTAKRDSWGRKHQRDMPEADWIRKTAPTLQIVTEDEWTAAHARMSAARAIYLKVTGGQTFGRPALGNPSKYLLTNLALCGCCGGSLKVRSRAHGTGRKQFYGCSGYHERGRTVCTNAADVPMVDADDIVIEALLDDVLDAQLLEDSVTEALRLLQGENPTDRIGDVDRELATVDQERSRLVAAITAGGQLDGLLQALQARETRRAALQAQRDGMRADRRLRASEADRVRDELLTLAGSWRRVLADDPTHARPIVSSLLKGRVTITPTDVRKRWTLSGEGSLVGLFDRVVVPGMTELFTPRYGVPRGDFG